MSNFPQQGSSTGSRFHSPDSPATPSSVPPAQAGASRKPKNESPPAPDSTTEPAPVQHDHEFNDGDDVFYRTDTGQNVLGTVGLVQGHMCQVLFGDGTQEWAQFKRLKKMNAYFEEERNKSQAASKASKKASTSTKTETSSASIPEPPPQPQIACASCGTTRKLSAKKAKLFEQGSSELFQCRRCKNKSPPSVMAVGSLAVRKTGGILAKYCGRMSGLYNKLPPDISIIPMNKSSSFSLPSTSTGPGPSTKFTRPQSSDGPLSIPRHIQFSVVPNTTPTASCFNCGKPVRPFDSVHCNMCLSSCHLSCLALNPSPLNGDKFWDLLCTPCGNQKTSETATTKVFSVRRNINSWSDVASLLIACLTAVSAGKKMFELETEIIPFLEGNIDRLHLPRQYKLATLEVQQKQLESAIKTSRMRFVNGSEEAQKATLWGLRTDSPLVMSYPQDKKNFIQTIAMGMGLKPSGIKINNPTKKNIPAALGSASQITTSASSSSSSPEAQFSNSNKQKTVPETKSENSFKTVKPGSPALKSNYQETGKTAKTRDTPEAVPKSLSLAERVQSRKPVKVKDGSPNKKGPNAKVKKSSKNSEGRESNGSSPRKKLTVKPIPDNTEESKLVRERTSSKSKNSPGRKKRLIREDSPESGDAVTSVRIPFPKKMKLVKDKNGSGAGDSRPNYFRVQNHKVAIKSPERVPPRKSKADVVTSDESSEISGIEDGDEGGEDMEVEEETARAIKTAAVMPLSAQQVQRELKTSPKISPPSTGGSPGTIRTGKPGRPRNSSLPGTPKPVRSPVISRLRTRGRGRPPGSKGQGTAPAPGLPGKTGKVGLKKAYGSNSLKLQVRQKMAGAKNNNGGPLVVSRRVGAFNSLRERRPSQLLPQMQNTEPSTNPIKVISSSLLDAAIFGDYRMECLPKSPQTEAQRKTEDLKVFAHFRAERENEIAALLLSRSETETRCQTRRKAELFVGRQKRDLNDFDSYEVIAKRVDPDGLTRYQVLWKGAGVDWDDDEEDEQMIEATVTAPGGQTANILVVSSPPKRKVSEVIPARIPVAPLRSRPGKPKSGSGGSLLFIDLTEDSS